MIFDRDIRHRVAVPTPTLPRPTVGAVAVNRARWGDLAAVSRLQRRAFRPALAYGFGTLIVLRALPNVRFLVARRGGAVIGCAIGDRHDGQTRVINVAVDPDARRRGVATALLRALERELPRGDLLLMVEVENLGAQALYRAEGYLPVGSAADYYGRGRGGIWMQKGRDGADDAPPKLRV
ncbi:MAG: hypothetical protein AVDCRST_MAG19-4528 [uncultured Thermomicrobiales bacterium]|uniref:N-acetyltransferase domain-containing protein n=1 Tax=uncultured Thermomicrobiales bacterium TaxID=1645740 RepID=A0A6J4VQ94_9BACT|nr:MAG: hypothetical protein AVDCRST_MAG19-4528 [uncultured Thermomicrobiales bacterium]